MRWLTLIIGGARSGKSRYAIEVAKRFKKRVAFIATATSADTEMRRRIRLHKSSRPRNWKVIEEGRDLSTVLRRLKGSYGVVIIDCLGLLVSNLLADGLNDKEIEKRLKMQISAIRQSEVFTILVSNEVGGGIVPDNLLGRRFRDIVGFTNQMLAEEADEVILMQSGIPIGIKGGYKSAKIK